MTTHQDEDRVRRALADEALGYRPPQWADRATAVRERGERRRRVRRTVASAVAVAVLGVGLAVIQGGIQAGRTGAASATLQTSSTSARPSATASWPMVRVVPAGRDLDFSHQIWMRLTGAEACVALGPAATRAYSCNSVTDGHQPQGSVSAREAADSSGALYAPLYVGQGDATRMTLAVHGRTYRATVVTLAGHPGYVTGFLWLPAGARTPRHASDVQITVYDSQGKVLAEAEVPGM